MAKTYSLICLKNGVRVNTKDEEDEVFNFVLYKTLDDVSAYNRHAQKNGWIKDGAN
jgi:hypothetical protein